MILLKTKEFEIAYKRSEFNLQMDKLRLILYVKNNNNKRYNSTIYYDYDPEDYQITVKKRLE